VWRWHLRGIWRWNDQRTAGNLNLMADPEEGKAPVDDPWEAPHPVPISGAAALSSKRKRILNTPSIAAAISKAPRKASKQVDSWWERSCYSYPTPGFHRARMQNGHYLGGWLRWLLPRPKVHLKCNESSRLVTPRIIVRPTRFLYTFQHFACSKLRLPSLLSWHFAYDLSVNMAEAILEIILNVMEFFIGQIL